MQNYKNLLIAFLLAAAIALAVPLEDEGHSMTTDLAKRQPPGKFQEVAIEVLLFGVVGTWLRFTWDCLAARFVRRTVGGGAATNGVVEQLADGHITYELALHPNGNGIVPRGFMGNTVRIPFTLQGQTIGLVFAGVLQDDNSIVLVVGNWTWPDMVFPTGRLTVLNLNTFESTAVDFPRLNIAEPRMGNRNDPPPAEGDGYASDADSSTNFRAK
jgi:hypothetical protein